MVGSRDTPGTGDSHLQWGTRRQLARRLGVSKRRVAQLVKRGTITEVDGKIDLDRAVGEYHRNIDRARAEAYRARHGRHLRVVPTAVPPPEAAPIPVANPIEAAPVEGAQDVFDFNDAKARKEHWNSERARLAAEQLAGKLVPREDVQTREFEIARKLRDRLLGFPAKLANYVPPEAMKTITEEVERLIREMQDDVAKF